MNDDDILAEMDRIRHQEAKGITWLGRSALRFIVRSLRILCGLVLVGFAWWAGSESLELLRTPFAAQSFVGLVGGVGLGILTFWLISGAFSAAFGEGPSLDQEQSRIRQKAIDRLGAASWERATAKPSHPSRKSPTAYELGHALGRLIGRRREDQPTDADERKEPTL